MDGECGWVRPQWRLMPRGWIVGGGDACQTVSVAAAFCGAPASFHGEVVNGTCALCLVMMQLVGSSPLLGAWEVMDAPTGTWTPGHIWCFDVELPWGAHEFKVSQGRLCQKWGAALVQPGHTFSTTWMHKPMHTCLPAGCSLQRAHLRVCMGGRA